MGQAYRKLVRHVKRAPKGHLVAQILEVQDSQSDLVQLVLFDPAASKQGHRYIPSIVKFPYLFNDAKVLDLSPQSIESLYSNAVVLVHIFTILCVGIVCVPIDVISFPRCHLSRWPLRQPTNGNRVYGFSRRYVLVLQPCNQSLLVLFHDPIIGTTISLCHNDSQVFINVQLHQLCTLQDTVMRPTHFFVIIVDEHFFSHWCPSQPAYPCDKNRVHQSLSVLLGTLDSTRRLL